MCNEIKNCNVWVSFVSVKGDYAWGREGLDSIVTQLLNQMDNATGKIHQISIFEHWNLGDFSLQVLRH